MKTDSFCEEQNKVEFHRAPQNKRAAFDLALHTDMPVGDDQASNEVSLAGYSRVSVMRDEDTWSIRGEKIANAIKITFPTITKGEVDATYLSIGISGKIRRLLKLDAPVNLKANRRVEFEPGDIEIVDRTVSK